MIYSIDRVPIGSDQLPVTKHQADVQAIAPVVTVDRMVLEAERELRATQAVPAGEAFTLLSSKAIETCDVPESSCVVGNMLSNGTV